LVGAAAVAIGLEHVGKQPPAIGRIGLERDGAAQCRDRIVHTARLTARNPELEVHGYGARLLQGERLEQLEGGTRTAGATVGCAQNETRGAKIRIHREDLASLLGRELGLLGQETFRVRKRNIDRTGPIGSRTGLRD
jgi:hypothetical protein